MEVESSDAAAAADERVTHHNRAYCAYAVRAKVLSIGYPTARDCRTGRWH